VKKRPTRDCVRPARASFGWLALASLVSFLLASLAAAAKLGVMGDSLSHEYEEVSYGSHAENWVEQLGG
jgi:hypothetical protein